jgi:hypothetical protein
MCPESPEYKDGAHVPDDLLKLVAVGDVQPYRAEPGELFALAKEHLHWGDVSVCQLEATLSRRGTMRTDVRNPAHRVPPEGIEALTEGGLKVVTFAGNNNLDYGLEAFHDTIELCRANGIAVVGAGDDLEEATAPVTVAAAGSKVAFVNFCSILRDGYAATPTRGGISPLRVSTFYEPLENIYEQPGTPSRTVTVVDHRDLHHALEMIRRARAESDFVVASFHWGVHFTHDLTSYQPDVAYAAIDAGADLVLGTHPHCLQGIDVYNGKFILYSLGNFAFEQEGSVAREGVSQYLSFYGLPTDKDLPQHPHPYHCRKTVIAKATIRAGSVVELRLVPCFFNSDAQPEPLTAGSELFDDVAGLIESLSAELGTTIVRDGDELVVLPEKEREIDVRDWVRDRVLSYPWLQRLAVELNGGVAAATLEQAAAGA